MCDFNSLVFIANAAFGDGKSTSSAPAKDYHDVTEGAPTFEAALGAMNGLLNWG